MEGGVYTVCICEKLLHRLPEEGSTVISRQLFDDASSTFTYFSTPYHLEILFHESGCTGVAPGGFHGAGDRVPLVH